MKTRPLMGLSFVAITANAQQPLDSRAANTEYSFTVHPGRPPLKIRVEIVSTGNTGDALVRQGGTPVDDPQTSSGVSHSLVCRHPETGRMALYLGRRRNAYIAGFPLKESEAPLDELWSRSTRDEFTWHKEWRLGDLVLWDNRRTMHRRDPLDPQSRRILHRAQIKGEHGPSA
jgi:taurine dioxygenase